MPTLVTHRGKQRYRGTVWVHGVRGGTKLFPDASKQSFRSAVEWENKEREKLRKQMNSIRTEFSTIRRWVNEYLSHVKKSFTEETYKEKRAVFERFGAFQKVSPEMAIKDIDRYLAADYFTALMDTPRNNGGNPDHGPGEGNEKKAHMPTGNAVNRDRKNLAAAWSWGKENMRGWPENVENPFLAVAKKKEDRSPRYVPPEEDFWKVYEYLEGLVETDDSDVHVQDRVMMLAYLHTAARRSELFNATWADVKFATKQIRLWTRKREGGALESDLIPMTEELTETLRAWKDRRTAMGTEDVDHIFVCLSGEVANEGYYGKPFTSRQHVMKKWCGKVGVQYFGWHAIRHLTASILYQEGESQAVVQSILRHKSPTTTARYLKRLGSNEARAVLDGVLRRDRTAQIIPFGQKKTA